MDRRSVVSVLLRHPDWLCQRAAGLFVERPMTPSEAIAAKDAALREARMDVEKSLLQYELDPSPAYDRAVVLQRQRLARIDDALAMKPDDGWRTMESAPKDGTWVLVAVGTSPFPWLAAYDDCDDYGWFSFNHYYERAVPKGGPSNKLIPTAWRPLPAPPEALK